MGKEGRRGRGSGLGIYMYIWEVATPLNETKKGDETSKANLKRGNIGIANMHKKYR